MVDARVVDTGERDENAWRRVVRSAGATFTDLRLLDGTLVLKVSRGLGSEQIRVIDGEAFDPMRSVLRIRMDFDGLPSSGVARGESLYAITTQGVAGSRAKYPQRP